MRFFDYLPRLFAPAGESDAGGPAVIDGGLPHEHDNDETDDTRDEPEQTPEQKRIAELEAQVANERTEKERARRDADYWANRGRGATDEEEELGARVGDDDELSPEAKEAAALREKLTPEQMLEMLTTDGPKALAKLGFVTAEQLHREVRAAEERGVRRVGAERADERYERLLSEEFPDIIQDSNRVAAGKAPVSRLFTRSGEIYREAVELDPQLKGSKSLLLTAARQAAAELGIKRGTREGPRQAEEPRGERTERPSRRDRVDAQRPPVDRSDGNDEERGPNEDQLHVAKMLRVSPKELSAHVGGGRPGRRGGR